MNRTCPPYSSSARLSRLPARLEWHGRRPAPPCPRRRRCDSRETRRRWRYRATAAYGPVAQPLLFLLKQRLKLIGHFRQGLLAQGHRAVLLPHYDIDLGEPGIGVGKIVAGMAAAAFFSLDGGQGRRLGEGQQRVQIEREMPP